MYYFSEQNSTFFPSRIIFVVRTAHIFPHIEQECLSDGGVCSKNFLAFSPSKGKMCAVRTTNMILEGKKVEFCSEK